MKYGFKFKLNDFTFKNKELLELYLNTIFICLFGEASNFSNDVVESKITNWFYISYGIVKDDYYHLVFDAETEFADLFIEKINKVINNIDISEDDYNRCKKIWYYGCINSMDNPGYLCDLVLSDVIKFGDISDQKKVIDSLKYEDIKNIIKELDFSNKSFVLMLPKEEERAD